MILRPPVQQAKPEASLLPISNVSQKELTALFLISVFVSVRSPSVFPFSTLYLSALSPSESPAGSRALRQSPVYTNGPLGLWSEKQITVGGNQ